MPPAGGGFTAYCAGRASAINRVFVDLSTHFCGVREFKVVQLQFSSDFHHLGPRVYDKTSICFIPNTKSSPTLRFLVMIRTPDVTTSD